MKESNTIQNKFSGDSQSDEFVFIAKKHFVAIRRWAKFLGIVNAISISILFFFAISIMLFGSVFSLFLEQSGETAPPPIVFIILGFVYMIIAGIQVVPTVFILKFASHTKSWFKNNENRIFDKALQNLGSLFTFYGVMTIIGLAMGGIGIIIFGFALLTTI